MSRNSPRRPGELGRRQNPPTGRISVLFDDKHFTVTVPELDQLIRLAVNDPDAAHNQAQRWHDDPDRQTSTGSPGGPDGGGGDHP